MVPHTLHRMATLSSMLDSNLGGLGRMQSRGQAMDRADSDECAGSDELAGNEARASEHVFCAGCAATLHLFIEILDSRNGRTHRLFRCLCGGIVWGD